MWIYKPLSRFLRILMKYISSEMERNENINMLIIYSTRAPNNVLLLMYNVYIIINIKNILAH